MHVLVYTVSADTAYRRCCWFHCSAMHTYVVDRQYQFEIFSKAYPFSCTFTRHLRIIQLKLMHIRNIL